ncbi:MAG: hypothetical protein IAE80_15465 [Anaerolinea sp.]|nr:hypothetical protein [Anaerolinea sp.]
MSLMKARRTTRDDTRNNWECVGCDLPLPLNEQGLCADCAGKLERDLIRARDWEYSYAAFLIPERQEALRAQIIREFGAANELLVTPKPKPKNKRSHSTNTKRKRAIAAAAIREYTSEDVLQAAHDFIQKQGDEWVNFSRVAQYLQERFYHLKPKRLGQPEKRHNSLLKMIANYPERFQIRKEADQTGIYWIRLTS